VRSSEFANCRAAALEAFGLRVAYVLLPLAIDAVPGRLGYACVAAGVALLQLAGSVSSALRTQRAEQTLYDDAGDSLARASAMVPLPFPEVEPELALGRALDAEARLRTIVRPAILGEGLALVALLVAIAISPQRLALVPLLAGAVVAGAAYIPIHRAANRREAVAVSRYFDVHRTLLTFMAERQERIAQGAAPEFVKDLRARSERHRAAALSAMSVRALVRRVPVALAIAIVIVAARGLSLSDALTPVHVLIALAVAQGGAVLVSTFAERAQLTLHAEPLLALLALPHAAPFGARRPATPKRISARGIGFAYDGAAGNVVSDVTFDVTPGRPLILRGENGSGKSTVLRLLAGLGHVTSGVISVDGVAIEELDIDAWRSNVAFVAQNTPFDAATSVRDTMHAASTSLSDQTLARALGEVGFDEPDALLARTMGTLSSGQRRRVQLARAFALDRRVLILDEPEAGLDAATQSLVRDLVARRARDSLVVVATHSRIFDEGVVLQPRRTEDTLAARAS
jgi:ABC-type bacteriocin/lantibiotic exporter with double-glycine peptidase domain